MYQKELKESFRRFVKQQANLARMIDGGDSCMWNCLYYFAGLNDAIFMSKQDDSYMKPFTPESFEYIFKSMVDYRREVH